MPACLRQPAPDFGLPLGPALGLAPGSVLGRAARLEALLEGGHGGLRVRVVQGVSVERARAVLRQDVGDERRVLALQAYKGVSNCVASTALSAK